MSTLDVRNIPPQEKHPTIFRMFDALSEGDRLTIINDHDLRPLMYQFKAERPDLFRWEPVASGPELWRVDIHKEQQHLSLGEMVQLYPQAASVFNRLKIDYCCQGKRKFAEACKEAGLDPVEVRKEVMEQPAEKKSLRVDDCPLPVLCDFIVSNHHTYVRTAGAEIHQLAEKVGKVHGEHHPELIKIYHEFIELHGELLHHLQKEEELLFPLIKKMDAGGTDMADVAPEELFRELEEEHEDAGTEMKRIRKITHDYQPPEDACQSYRLLFRELQAFEEDLYRHVYLENHILMPRFRKQLEASVDQR
jgi:regulator of cell morphogenesis and NO signaling